MSSIFRIFSLDLAIDLGTANTLIYEKNKGIILNEPSIVAVVTEGGKRTPRVFGTEAKIMQGRVPETTEIVRPVRTGVIADFDVATSMLQAFLTRAIKASRSLMKPRVIAGIPSGVTEVEKRAIYAAIESVTREVKLVDEAIAAAIGAGLPVTESRGSMVVDIGGGTTDIAVISLTQIVCSESAKVGGDAMDLAVSNFLRRHHHLLVGDSTAELVKKTLGTAHPDYDQQEMRVYGRNVAAGIPGSVVVTSAQIREALEPTVAQIILAVRQTLERIPPELLGDLMQDGIVLTGGGGLLKGLDRRISEEFQMPVKVADNALNAVAHGAGKCLQEPALYKHICI